jgi:hypothetical protein
MRSYEVNSALTCRERTAQVERATTVARMFVNHFNQRKEMDMSTSKPIELGKASEETKEGGHQQVDNLETGEGFKVL